MRQNKFRAWNPSSKKMEYTFDIDADGNVGRINMFGTYETCPEWILMQYIGVKGYEGYYENRRYNEVKLYAGDIVEAMSEGSKSRFVIQFRQHGVPMWILYPAFQSGKHWNINASDVDRAKGDYYDDLRRIGNIYENPGLIQQQQ